MLYFFARFSAVAPMTISAKGQSKPSLYMPSTTFECPRR